MHCFLNMTKLQNIKLSQRFHTHKFILLLALLGLFTGRNNRFLHPFIYLKPDNGTHFGWNLHLWEGENNLDHSLLV